MKKRYRLCALLGVTLLYTFAYFRSDGFVVTKLNSPIAYSEEWHIPKTDDWNEILKILDQPFHYLDSGRQCFVFESADKRYVIKFLNHARFYMSDILKKIPLPDSLDEKRAKKIQTRTDRIENFFNSFKIGYDLLKEETGILFMQLKPSGHFEKKLKILDVSKHAHEIDLNSVNFILQKRADSMIYPYLSQLDEVSFREAIDQILELVGSRIEKGIMDDDLNVEVNIGFLDQKPLMIDIGRLFLDPTISEPQNYASELEKSTRFLEKWLESNHPKMAEYLRKERSNGV